MTTQLDILRTFPQSKVDIQALACDWTNQILEGNSDPIKVAIQIKAIQTVLDQVNAGIKDYVLSESEKYEGKTFTKEGAKIEVSDMGVKYDYSTCGDPTWDELNRKITELTTRRKAREEFLKVIPENGSVDPETGSIFHRPARTATRGIKITIL